MATITESNPLLKSREFVLYSQIEAEHIVPAVKEVICQAKKILEEILVRPDIALTFENTLLAFIKMEDIIDKVWTPVENLLALVGEDDIRKAAEEARPLVVDFFNDYSLDERVYKLIKKFAATHEANKLTGERKRHLENTLLDFKLAGAELNEKDKEEFKDLNLKLAELSHKFSDNVIDSKFNLVITNERDLAGIPADIVQMSKLKADELRVRQDGNENGQSVEKIPDQAWVFNLDYPSYAPFMKFADNGNLRKKMYLEFLTRATRNDKNNNPIILELFKSKTRQAKLLSFTNYAEVSLQTKMAKDPEKVKSFLERLASRVRALAEREYQSLVKFQKEIDYNNTENNPDKVLPWDKEYLSEKLRAKEYAFDTNLLKPYFELKAVIKGMFGIAERIFQIKVEKINAETEGIETWHQEDVAVYEIIDTNDSSSISSVGFLYMDLYPRDTKRQGAWMMPLVCGAQLDSQYRRPQCTIACNLTQETQNTPSLLTHTEVITLFHEFGHALHHLLTKVKLAPLSGTSVEWDFVELPSQLFENFAWERDSLKTFAKHYQTGEPIPDSLLDKMIKARNFNEGLACTRQLEFALFDLTIYLRDFLDSEKAPNVIYQDICEKYGVFETPEDINFPASFSHIFGGGYAAGYYSYKWAEVLEADAFNKFVEEGVLNPRVGKEYKEKILEKGDSEPPMDLFKSFMGREPDENALLKKIGVEYSK